MPGAAAATGPEQAAIDLTGGRRDQGEGTAGTVGAGSRGRKRQRATEGRGRRRVSAGDKSAGKKSRAGGSRGGAAGLARTRGQDGRAGGFGELRGRGEADEGEESGRNQGAGKEQGVGGKNTFVRPLTPFKSLAGKRINQYLI